MFVRNPATSRAAESCARRARDRLVPVTAFILFLLYTQSAAAAAHAYTRRGGGVRGAGRRRGRRPPREKSEGARHTAVAVAALFYERAYATYTIIIIYVQSVAEEVFFWGGLKQITFLVLLHKY